MLVQYIFINYISSCIYFDCCGFVNFSDVDGALLSTYQKWKLTVIHHQEIMVINPYPFLVVMNQLSP